MRFVVALAAVWAAALVLAVAPTARGATRQATDREAGVRFTLDDRVLTVRLLATAPRRVRRQVYGKRITAACTRYSPMVKVVDTRRWRSGKRSLRFRFRRNISRAVSWCLIEHRRGGDIAFVNLHR